MHHIYDNRLQILVLNKEQKSQTSVGSTSTWNWQQGAMAHWFNHDYHRLVIFNCVDENLLGMKIVLPDGTDGRFIPWPIQTLNPRKPEALALNYKRLNVLRECYGYKNPVTNFACEMSDSHDGIWRIDLEKGTGDLTISLEQLRGLHFVPGMKDAPHKVNHCIYSPDGERFVFMHRYFANNVRYSRLYVSRPDGKDIKLLLEERMVSHYHWFDDNYIVAYARTSEHGDRYYKINVHSGEREVIGEGILQQFGDGHCTVSPDRKFLLSDTYPDKARNQKLFIYDLENREAHVIGTFFSPWKYDDYSRCDLHPRWSQDGRWISIDSVCSGERKNYVVDVRELVGLV
jgi:hypothetical protein